MNLTVKIIRHPNPSYPWKSPGALSAFVVQSGTRGNDLLKRRRFENLDDARIEITNHKDLKGHTLTFIDPPPIEQQPPLKSARDNYGMGGVQGRTRTKAQ